MKPGLLDVNVLIAIFDSDHPHFEPAHLWLSANRAAGWATCPITENGCVRIASNITYSGVRRSVTDIRARLTAFCNADDHLFWRDEISLRDDTHFDPSAAVSSRQVTDIYLLALAKHHGGRLATFDRTIPVKPVVGATAEHLAIIPA